MKHTWLTGFVSLVLTSSPAFAKNVTYVLAIGNNAPPVDHKGESLAPLRYADDDAASVYEWATTFAAESKLLSVLDLETQRRYPKLAAVSVPPTLVSLRASIQYFHAAVEAAHARGDSVTFIFFMSSHGSLANRTTPASLALLDGDLTQDLLYNEILAQLPADHVHLLVDACHAESVIRPRGGDLSAQVVDISPEDTRRWLESNTLARFPNVGAMIATASDEEAHEWSTYQGGIFTHQLLSGLRGAADVNGDKRVEYSEMHAFLGAANLAIDDARARLKVLTRAPPSDLRFPLVDLSQARNIGWITDLSSTFARFYVEDSRGVRYVDANVEAGVSMRLALPAGQTYYLHTASDEASFLIESGRVVSARSLTLTPSTLATRDATVSTMARGLFATPFGPAYYRGFVDNSGEIPVEFFAANLPTDAHPRFSNAVLYTPWVISGASVIASGILGGLMYRSYNDYTNTNLQRPAADARATYDTERTLLYVSLGTGLASAIVGTVLHVLNDDDGTDFISQQ